MKKTVSIILALVMILSLSTTAFATTIGANGSQDIPVTGIYNTSTTTSDVYSVDIVWSSMTFTYNEKGTQTWDPTTHSYTTTYAGTWDKTSANVTVTNHSNVPVTVSAAYTQVDAAVTGTLNKTQQSLAAGVEGAYNDADAVTFTLTIGGKPTTVSATGVAIGKLTISIR